MIKKYLTFINELVISSKISNSGSTREIDTILDENPSIKSRSSGLLLRNKLQEKEAENELEMIGIDVTKLKRNIIIGFKNHKERLLIALSNIDYLKQRLKKDGELRCEYCNAGPLIIYDQFHKEGEFNEFIKYSKFNTSDGATCDHKNPISKGGEKFDKNNLCVCCSKHNTRKGSMKYDSWINLIRREK